MWFLSEIRAHELLGLSDVRNDNPLIYISFFHQKEQQQKSESDALINDR